jgi:hypothetical protein
MVAMGMHVHRIEDDHAVRHCHRAGAAGSSGCMRDMAEPGIEHWQMMRHHRRGRLAAASERRELLFEGPLVIRPPSAVVRERFHRWRRRTGEVFDAARHAPDLAAGHPCHAPV